jgi:hypothetical protein
MEQESIRDGQRVTPVDTVEPMRSAWLLVIFIAAGLAAGGCGTPAKTTTATAPTSTASQSSALDVPTSSTSRIDYPTAPPVDPSTAQPTPSKSPSWVECGRLPYESREHNLALRAKATPPATCTQARTVVAQAFERLKATDSTGPVTVSGWRCKYSDDLYHPIFDDLHCTKGALIVDGYAGSPNKPS